MNSALRPLHFYVSLDARVRRHIGHAGNKTSADQIKDLKACTREEQIFVSLVSDIFEAERSGFLRCKVTGDECW